MKKREKNMFKLHYLAVLLILILIIPSLGTPTVSAAERKKSPYLIKVNRTYNTITIYDKDEMGEYNLPIKAMVCSVGTGSRTISGTFATKEKYRWKALMGDVWGQYATRIVGGILFHSVYYYENGNPGSLATAEFNKLGTAASHGCIRLTVQDAKWIYDNCEIGTTVIVYDDKKSPGPLGKPEAVKIPKAMRWDPSDPDERNPYVKKLPQILGVKNYEINWGDKVDLLKGITVKSSVGKDITSKLEIKQDLNPYIAGKYRVNYMVVDEYDRLNMRSIKITVKECIELPTLSGITDRAINEEVVIDKDYALKGVTLSYLGEEIDRNLIKVVIKNNQEDEYYITYKINLGNKLKVTEHALLYVDREAPTFLGIADQPLQPDEVMDINKALQGITVSDNFSILDPSDIAVSLETTPEGNHLVTYLITDEAGNTAIAQATFYYELNFVSVKG